ncbi:hypothetical protein MA03_06715 [Infirmifilum uzonense]|uniref:Uncharacterized protein n=1 Tax=Infirmifilum uzonense TaxID=1550241 RepID=A0A0F7CL90_9CREN|nr:DHH family phosphoesterase [Infirmifilum uzonense]AKG38996.1 hypothetical protein MA03_06715 [Infirmifilum uzonense]
MAGIQDLLSHALPFFEGIKREKSPVLVVSHYDADGLSSASILSWMLTRLDVPFQLVFVEQTYPDTLEELPFSNYKHVIFLDLGSGYKDFIKTFASNKQVLIVDHHVPAKSDGWEGLIEINPYLVGVDASTQTSSSSLSYSIVSRVLGDSVSLLPVAVAGALGDRLDVGEKFSLTGLNKEIVEKGKKLGVIEEFVSLRLFGIKKKTIVEAIASTLDPFIPGLSGNPSACIKFLESIGIQPRSGDSARLASSLSQEEIKLLASELIKYMISNGVNVKEAEKIFGYNYYLVPEPDASPLKDLREYAFVLNALGRLDHYGTAMALNLGFRGKYIVRVEESIKEYRRLLAKQLSRIFEKGEEIARHGKQCVIYFLDENLPKLTGPLSSIIANDFSQKFKASHIKIIGIAAPTTGEKYKISFRRIDESIDLGNILQKLSRELGFMGGGHPAAGGALIDEKILDKLLEKI